MKTTHLFILLLFSLGVSAQPPTGAFSVKGFLPAWKGAEMVLSTDDSILYAGTLTADIFSYNGITSGQKLGQLSIRQGTRTVFVPLVIEPGTIRVRTLNSFTAVAFGTPANNLYDSIVLHTDSILRSREITDPVQARDLRRKIAAAFILRTPRSPWSLHLLETYFYRDVAATDSFYKRLYDGLDPALKKSAKGRTIGAELGERYAVSGGVAAPFFQVREANGLTTRLPASGKVTVISFWASWCAPCRREYPRLLELLQRYAGKRLEVVRVSLDTNPAAWHAAKQKQPAGWKQVFDGRGWETGAALAYGVHAIPATFVVDSAGIMVGRAVSVEDLEAKLKELLK